MKDIKLNLKQYYSRFKILTQSYNFKSTWTGNYEIMRNVYRARRNHKQREFRDFCKIIENEFPYSELITTPREG